MHIVLFVIGLHGRIFCRMAMLAPSSSLEVGLNRTIFFTIVLDYNASPKYTSIGSVFTLRYE